MKLTAKRKRADSAAAAVAAVQAAAMGPLEPPAHVTLRPQDRAFWDGIVTARPRDTWTTSDLVMAASLARTQADIETLQALVDSDGLILDGKPHPACELLEKATRRAMALSRAIAVNTMATVGRSADIAKGATLEREARQDAEDDDLIPGTRRAYLSVGRKNGKSGAIAALLLAHLVGPEAKLNAQIVSGALSRDQAALVFNLAAKMVQLSPKLSKLVRIIPSGKRLIGLPLNTEYKALAADGKTAHGASPALAILDETGQVRGPQSDFIDAITTAQGAHADPLLIVISTQAASDADLLSIWLDDAERSNDPRIVSHVYAAPEGADLMDESAWRAANPALGLFRSEDDLREQMTQARRMPSMENSARNLLLNQRVSTDAPFVSPDVWKSCAGPVLPFDGPVFGGLDLSMRTDLTAFVLIGRIGGVWHVQPTFWTPEKGLLDRERKDRSPYSLWERQGFLKTTPGRTVDYAFVAADIARICAGLDVQGIAYDRWRIDLLRQEFEKIGASPPLVEWGQGFKDMAPALDALEAELLNGRIAHGGHPVLSMCAANATTVKDPTGARKLDKAKATGRIDGLQAMAQAFGLAARIGEVAEREDAAVFFV